MGEENILGYSFLGPDMEAVSEIIADRLYFVTFRKKEFTKVDRDCHFFNTDQQFKYTNYFDDFGPLNLAQLYRYWLILREKLACPTLYGKRIVHWTTTDFKKRANAAFLVGCFALIQLKMSPDYIHRLLLCGKHPYVPFQDASQGISKYRIKLIDCLNAIDKALESGFFRFQDFDLAHFEHYEKIQNGDVSWLVPEKFLAFSGPTSQQVFGCTPETYLPYFKLHGIQHIVRLNRPNYSDFKFTNVGIKIHDMFFPDGSVPCKSIVYTFLALAEDVNGPLAVHCKAGLGRTGCLIGAYIVKHYKMTALEAIAWMRICRPGCVIGHQQVWLERMQHYLKRSGQLYRLRVYGDVDHTQKLSHGIYSLNSKKATVSDSRSLTKSIISSSGTSYVNVKAKDTNSLFTLSKEKKAKVKTFQTVIKLGERKKNTNKEKENFLCEENKVIEQEQPKQGDTLKMRKWENNMQSSLLPVGTTDKINIYPLAQSTIKQVQPKIKSNVRIPRQGHKKSTKNISNT